MTVPPASLEDVDHLFGELTDGQFVVRTTDVENLPAADAAGVFNDSQDAVDGIINQRVCTSLVATVNQLQRCASR